MNWQLNISLAVVLLSVAILLQRDILKRNKLDSTVYAVLFQMLVALILLPVVLIHGVSFAGFKEVLPLIGIATVGFGLGSTLYGATLKRVDASAFSVLFATQAIWIMLAGALFLAEKMTFVQAAGAFLILASVLILVKDPRQFRTSRGVVLGLLTGLAYGIAIAASGYVSRRTDTLTWVMVSFILGAAFSLAIDARKTRRCLDESRTKIMRPLFIMCIFYAFGTLTMNIAYADGPFSLVGPIRQSGIIVTTLLALAYMQDERTDITRKITAAFVCFLGVVLTVL